MASWRRAGRGSGAAAGKRAVVERGCASGDCCAFPHVHHFFLDVCDWVTFCAVGCRTAIEDMRYERLNEVPSSLE